MGVWDITFNTDPLGTDVIADGDNEIRDTRAETRIAFAVEHDVGDTTIHADWTDTGRHITGSARTYFGPLAFSTLMRPTNAGNFPPTNSNDDKLASNLLDNGRLWIDTDDCQPYVREQEEYNGVNWTPTNVAGPAAGSTAWVSLWPRQWSVMLTANNNNQPAAVADTREPIDGTYDTGGGGAYATTLGVEIAVPDDGKVYEILVEADCTCGMIAGADQQFGFWLVEDPNGNLTAPGPTDVDERLIVLHNNDVLASTSLRYLQNSVTNGDTYTYIVEFAIESASANQVINPDFNLHHAGAPAFAAATSYSRLIAHLRPRNLTAASTV